MLPANSITQRETRNLLQRLSPSGQTQLRLLDGIAIAHDCAGDTLPAKVAKLERTKHAPGVKIKAQLCPGRLSSPLDRFYHQTPTSAVLGCKRNRIKAAFTIPENGEDGVGRIQPHSPRKQAPGNIRGFAKGVLLCRLGASAIRQQRVRLFYSPGLPLVKEADSGIPPGMFFLPPFSRSGCTLSWAVWVLPPPEACFGGALCSWSPPAQIGHNQPTARFCSMTETERKTRVADSLFDSGRLCHPREP